MKLLLIVCSLLYISTLCAAQMVPSQQTSTQNIRGKVLQEPGEQPIRKVNVHLNEQMGAAAAQYSAVTDSQGQFSIEDVRPGSYMVTLERPGFVQSGGSSSRTTTISAQPDSGSSELIFHMEPAAVIVGKIVDLDGDPMAGVGVTATKTRSSADGRMPHNSGNGFTNDLGEYRISDLSAGRYKITAAPPQQHSPASLKDGSHEKEQSVYLPTFYPGVLEESQATTVQIAAGSETQISFGVLTGRTFHVRGLVTGVPGESGMNQLMLIPKGRGSAAPPQQLKHSGEFEFSDVLPGTYQAQLVVVGFEGGQPRMQIFRLGQTIEVANANVEGLRLQPEAPGQVRGKLRMDTDQKFDWTQLSVSLFPVDGESIEFMGDPGFGMAGISGVNTDGTFEIKNSPGGNYLLLVGASSDSLRDYFTKSVTLAGRDVSDSGFPVLPETFLDVVVSAKGAAIDGTVIDAKGQPVANAIVLDVPGPDQRLRPDLYQQDTTDENGHFSLRGLNPGKYTVLAFDDVPQDFRQPAFLKSYESRGEIVQLDEGMHKNVTLRVIPQEVEAP